MIHKDLFNSNTFLFLIKIDEDYLSEVKKAGCECGGVLHKANYPRSPMGLQAEYRQFFEVRFSLCCAVCRKRTATPSIRFFGRRWYPALIFLFISLLQKSLNERRKANIRKHFGISLSKSTWRRWRRWWHDFFLTTAFWKQARGTFTEKALLGPYPKSLFTLIKGASFTKRIILFLQFLSPLTAGFLRAV